MGPGRIETFILDNQYMHLLSTLFRDKEKAGGGKDSFVRTAVT
jgi:stalled ribosome alternative rescue factor ArfA